MDHPAHLIVIPADRLSPAALQGVIEEFITREGTDYGEVEIDLAAKVEQVRALLRRGEAVIVFDAETESCTLMTGEELRRLSGRAGC